MFYYERKAVDEEAFAEPNKHVNVHALKTSAPPFPLKKKAESLVINLFGYKHL